MRKKYILPLMGFLVFGVVSVVSAAMFQSVPASKAQLMQKGEQKQFCNICGMNLVMFYKTNYVALVNGKTKQYCSIHCLVEDRDENHVNPQNIKVVAVDTLQLIDADKAYFVVGSSKKGTMSMVSKYAFSSLNAASKFAAKFGGVVTDFNGALETAKEDFAKDSHMIGKKQHKMSQMGAMIYAKKCKKIEKDFHSVAEAKAFVSSHKTCKDLNPKELQAVGLYLINR
ncbi:MAG: nitrous oxide reductase accessory protein NosL [Epsilonproteobacteria bacterium]|nr:nitrous oxide reductase accessory protein NosL [Campylobacterota bacterium]